MGKVCCFIGHRNVKKTTELKEKLTKTVCGLITENGVDKFLFGSKCNFDDFCQEVVKELREEYPHIRRVYVRTYYPELGEPSPYQQNCNYSLSLNLSEKLPYMVEDNIGLNNCSYLSNREIKDGYYSERRQES